MDRTGQTLLLQAFVPGSKSVPSVVLKFRGAQDEAYLSVPALGVTLRADRYRSLPEEGYLVPVYLVRAYLGNRATPLFSRTLWKNESYQWQGIIYTMTPEDYAVLNVVSDAGWWVAAMGLLLLVVGSILQRWPTPLLARFEAPKVEDEGMTVIEVAVWYRRDREVSGRGAAEAFLKQVGTSEK
jgi:hypothetical protein